MKIYLDTSVKWVRDLRNKLGELWYNDPIEFEKVQRVNTQEFKKKYIKRKKQKR